MLIKGRVWKFGDNIDTDQMMPQSTFKLPVEEQARSVFKTIRPGWADQVKQGEIILAGKNFGLGSSRPAARVFRFLGIEAIVAESMNGLFFRNCINYGLLALNVPGVSEHFQEGEVAEVDPRTGMIKNLNTGVSLRGPVLPEMLIGIVQAGGMIELLRKEGCLTPVEQEE